jgi:cobaltochelatase CobS
MKRTFNDVIDLLMQSSYNIEKDKAFTVRRFIVTNLKTKAQYPIRYIPTMTEMYNDILKKGVEQFLKDQDASDNVSNIPRVKTNKTNRSRRAARVMPSQEEMIATPRALKARREGMVVESEVAVPAVALVRENIQHQETMQVNNFVHEVEAQIEVAQPIDYTIKIPKYFDGYYFPSNVSNMVTRLALGRNLYFQGDTGAGKSDLADKLAKLFGAKIIRINFNTGTTEQHMIGRFVVRDGRTKFVYGVIPLAMKHGWWVLLDEIDYAQPEHLSAIQSVLEGNPLLVSQNENEEIVPHENFRLFATGNTKGRGDGSQSFTGTNFLNAAFLDRWSLFELDYTPHEDKICAEFIKDEVFIGQLIQYFQLLRKASKSGELSNASFSTRRLIQICEVMMLNETLKDALTYELWSRYDEHEIAIMQELAYDVWPREHYFKGGWAIGSEHAQDNAPVAPVTQP